MFSQVFRYLVGVLKSVFNITPTVSANGSGTIIGAGSTLSTGGLYVGGYFGNTFAGIGASPNDFRFIGDSASAYMNAASGGLGSFRVNNSIVAVYTTAGIQNTVGEARRIATQTVTDSTTFTNDNTLSLTLIAGRKYRFKLWYAFTVVNTSGVKVDLAGGAATMTAINGMIYLLSGAGAVTNFSQITALSSSAALTATGTLHFAVAEGSFECNAGGTFIPRFAQNAETGAAESVVAQIGSYLTIADVP